MTRKERLALLMRIAEENIITTVREFEPHLAQAGALVSYAQLKKDVREARLSRVPIRGTGLHRYRVHTAPVPEDYEDTLRGAMRTVCMRIKPLNRDKILLRSRPHLAKALSDPFKEMIRLNHEFASGHVEVVLDDADDQVVVFCRRGKTAAVTEWLRAMMVGHPF